VDFIGTIKSAAKTIESAGFPPVHFTRKAASGQGLGMGLEEEDKSLSPQAEMPLLSSEDTRASHFDAMRADLEKLNLLPEQKDGLLDRIRRKIILSPQQLRADSVRLERVMAGGMDFSGKVHIIESAISSSSMVELEYENPNEPDGEGVIVVGNPLSVEKMENDALIRIELIPQHEEKLFSIGKARMVKRIRGSVLR
ncbi:MAG: hypothetical protein II684_05885, partial [Treponema sp.]|nr:hypothetical protein [Treponema sp.]